MMKVLFVGAGPGDKELITLKGYKALKEADMVIWAGSLVNEALLEYCKADVEIHNSALMDLEEILSTCAKGVRAGKKVVRLHTGDFSIYGSLREQIEGLQALGIEYELIPGVSSFLGAASSLGVEYTVPEVSQSLIITRRGGRTPVPEKESLKAFAQHGTSMVIFLSSTYVDEVCKELIEGGYDGGTPAAIVFKATWQDEEIIRGTLMTLPALAKEKNIHKMSLIMVGDFLGHEFNPSKLYQKDFKHEYRT
ncbi:MAG: precorrin-4 C(11)-methyltransferase [Firmicutes bacterium HGW-Firmicutes-5]|nr:MAG: precorrin-4 C(11)-methyltransferase [Firmicutes bacterium HGW-Firmicutes-5]